MRGGKTRAARRVVSSVARRIALGHYELDKSARW
jgi:hypothetical protein